MYPFEWKTAVLIINTMFSSIIPCGSGITECWLAEMEGIFLLITKVFLVINRAWLLDAD